MEAKYFEPRTLPSELPQAIQDRHADITARLAAVHEKQSQLLALA